MAQKREPPPKRPAIQGGGAVVEQPSWGTTDPSMGTNGLISVSLEVGWNRGLEQLFSADGGKGPLLPLVWHSSWPTCCTCSPP